MPATQASNQLIGSIRMTLTTDQFLSELKPPRLRAGTVVLVNEETAERWERIGVAVPAAETDKTAAEQKRLQLEALRKEIEELENGTAEVSGMFEEPAPRRVGRPRKTR